GMRLAHAQRAARFGYGPESVTLLSTPLSSNITTVALYSTLVNGGAVVLMPKFDSAEFLALSERHKVTHTTAVPVQYSRILAHPDFGKRDLCSYKAKISVGSALPEDVKRDLLARWPGSMNDLYASTEGGVTCILAASEFPHKLHSIGKPAPYNDVRMIGEDGK